MRRGGAAPASLGHTVLIPDEEADVEAQPSSDTALLTGDKPPSPPPPSETSTSSATAGLWLLAWLVNNMGVTLLNKWAFAKVDFPHPFLLSAVHMVCNASGAAVYFVIKPGERAKRKDIGATGFRTILAFSLLFSANIAVGNASLRHVSVNFNQVARSLVPGVVMVASMACLGKSYSSAQQLALVPVVVGVMLACFGEMHFTTLGFCMTMLCVALAAAKVVLSNIVLTGPLKLEPMDLLLRM